mmetsp:Transcript_5693/g.22480  ORF Transcript_5693/g.22480 Transcript_5693/m.22480 type:complete len:209 (-) Transcript_5693:2107-2733(-)
MRLSIDAYFRVRANKRMLTSAKQMTKSYSLSEAFSMAPAKVSYSKDFASYHARASSCPGTSWVPAASTSPLATADSRGFMLYRGGRIWYRRATANSYATQSIGFADCVQTRLTSSQQSPASRQSGVHQQPKPLSVPHQVSFGLVLLPSTGLRQLRSKEVPTASLPLLEAFASSEVALPPVSATVALSLGKNHDGPSHPSSTAGSKAAA